MTTMTLGKLKMTTPGEREIRIEREFDAARELVWQAWTQPELVRRWLLGPDGWDMPVCEMDVRVGGSYRWVWRKASTGAEMAMGGTYREVVRPERLVTTEKFDDPWYPGECVATTSFTERAGRTTVVTTMLLDTQEIRDGVLKSGMERGMERSYERIDEILPTLVG
jgi:uncharacterized protein YndB with AHSA1/START domain